MGTFVWPSGSLRASPSAPPAQYAPQALPGRTRFDVPEAQGVERKVANAAPGRVSFSEMNLHEACGTRLRSADPLTSRRHPSPGSGAATSGSTGGFFGPSSNTLRPRSERSNRAATRSPAAATSAGSAARASRPICCCRS